MVHEMLTDRGLSIQRTKLKALFYKTHPQQLANSMQCLGLSSVFKRLTHSLLTRQYTHTRTVNMIPSSVLVPIGIYPVQGKHYAWYHYRGVLAAVKKTHTTERRPDERRNNAGQQSHELPSLSLPQSAAYRVCVPRQNPWIYLLSKFQQKRTRESSSDGWSMRNAE